MTRQTELRIVVTQTKEDRERDRSRVQVIDANGRQILAADFWDGGPAVTEAISGFVICWLNEASWWRS